jgi:pimeloyl-ACP methyl ester carboxylesterase
MKNLSMIAICLSLWSCKTTQSNLSSAEDQKSAIQRIENNEVRKLWTDHVASETKELNTSGKDILADCKPRFYPHRENTSRKGMVMFFHGFTACPQQYFDIADMLSAEGFDVFLPLMPGQGRAATGKEDYLKDLPSKSTLEKYSGGSRQHPRYIKFVETMNAIAKASTGAKVLAGLSGGGGLATGAAIAGQSENGNIWTRILLYAPYYKNPSINGAAADFVGFFNPGVTMDWGEACRYNRARIGGRAGYCSISVGATLAMVQFGEAAAAEIGKLRIPVQFVVTELDPTADNSAISNAFSQVKDARICSYPYPVPHSLINPNRDLLPDIKDDSVIVKMRDKNAPSGPPYEWVDALNGDSVRFLTTGEWFPSSGESVEEKKYKNSFPMCNPATLTPQR